MLEFLGMESEANTLVTCFMILGLSIGIISGYIGGSKDSGGGILGIILYILCGISGVIAFIKGLGPGIALFFTFQWGIMLKGLFLGILIGLISGFIFYKLLISMRIKKYARNPLMKEIVLFCKERHIVGVLCYKKELFFFTDLANAALCESEHRAMTAINHKDSLNLQASYTGPKGLAQLQQSASCVGKILLSERNYPDIPDLNIFAKALAKKWKDCKIASHSAHVSYKTTKYDTNRKAYVTTDYITHLYDDAFVFKRNIYRHIKKQEKTNQQIQNKLAKENAKHENKWE